MFHSDYKHIIDRLPESLVKRTCERLLHHSKDPVPLESIFGKSERIESYLRHTLEIYENSLNRKKYSGVQTDNSAWPDSSNQMLKHYPEENNSRVMNELKILSQHLLDYNKQTFGKFMHDIEKEYREQVNANKKMRYGIKNLKMQVLEAEKELASMKSNSIY
ncbi:hypothetical protein RclHR1_31390002 [Rhizophagus clarus]|uniref:Uncharacterized protein n=1 Tax=Rhizophagus clarus TaxID=94130 RepID=A0A2Z6R7M0_9GLOM|nr:hypothetical protein RclHR1_31390002 [Rhizophagus clarus]